MTTEAERHRNHLLEKSFHSFWSSLQEEELHEAKARGEYCIGRLVHDAIVRRVDAFIESRKQTLHDSKEFMAASELELLRSLVFSDAGCC